MRKKLSSYLLLLLPFISCSSDSEANNEGALETSEDVVINNGNSLLWKIEGNGIKASYCYGTMHMINEEFYDFPDPLKKRIAKSEAIIMEIDGFPNPLTTFQMMSLDSGTVHDYFTPEQLVEVLQFMDEEMGMTPQEFDQTYGAMKPFFLMQTITQKYFEPNAKSYDLEIMGIAAEKEIPIVGLETIEEQLGFFDQVPSDNMAEMILQSIRDYNKEAKDVLKMMELYSKQKVDKFIPLMQKQSPEIMEFSDLFLYDRNRAWIPKLEKEMAEKSCFIAVGAGHLFGENGIIDLLEKQGYTLTAISSAE